MRILYLSTLFVVFFLSDAKGQESYREELLAKWDNAVAYTLEVAELMPDSAYTFRPTDEQRTFRGQLLHTAGNMIWLSQNYLGHSVEGFDFAAKRQEWEKADYNKEETIEEVSFALHFAREAIAGFDLNQLDEKVDFFAGPMSKRQILTLLNDHHTHHRAQMIVYLRLQGLRPPRYRGW